MWRLLRPDAVSALDQPLVRKILSRYVKVAKGILPANFQIAKRIAVSEISWKEHEKAMKEFYELRQEIDNNKVDFTKLKPQKLSLLELKLQLAKEILKSCELCERKCRVNRLSGELGECKVGNNCLISSEFVHLGEESHIVPSHTVFFMGCNFHCQYCQNWSISQWYESGTAIKPKELARLIEQRRKEGCRNLNLVGGSPTPHLPWIIEALKHCEANTAVIWNSNMYMSEKTMQILDGIVDMYLSDFKYGNDKCALRLSKVPNYFSVVSRNHLLAAKTAEITLRHLILPNHLECCTKPVLKWISENLKEKCLVNLMDQYRPEWKARLYPEINRRISSEEYETALEYAKKLGLNLFS